MKKLWMSVALLAGLFVVVGCGIRLLRGLGRGSSAAVRRNNSANHA